MYSPASEDAGSRSEGSTDSKSSLDVPIQNFHLPSLHQYNHSLLNRQTASFLSHHEGYHVFGHGIGPALAALRNKRKKFSASRTSTPINTHMGHSPNSRNLAENSVNHIATAIVSRVTKKQLQRSSSMPLRSPESETASHK